MGAVFWDLAVVFLACLVRLSSDLQPAGGENTAADLWLRSTRLITTWRCVIAGRPPPHHEPFPTCLRPGPPLPPSARPVNKRGLLGSAMAADMPPGNMSWTAELDQNS